MSPRYEKEVADLTEWFKAKLAELPEFKITQMEYNAGVDLTGPPYIKLAGEAFDEWLSKRNYELSYNQMCMAFFGAAKEIGKLTVT